MEIRGQSDIGDERDPAYEGVADHRRQIAFSRSSHTITRVTIVVPVHNEVENIKAVSQEILTELEAAGLNPRIFLVDDGSSDASLSVIREMADADARIDCISFSRNFGKEVAIMAGLSECGDEFDALAYMDSDGQHSAADLLRLIEAAQSPDIDLVCGVRTNRDYQTGQQRRLTHMFYGLFRRLSDAPIDEGAGDFNVMKPAVVYALRALREEYPFLKGLVGWIGFRKKLVPISIKPRAGGITKSSIPKMLKLAFGAIVSFSSWPLRAWSVIGICSSLAALVYLLSVVAQTIIFGREVPGYATTVVLLLGLGGLQLFSIGILGEYVARIYDASKHRPRYIIAWRTDI